jgi:hypothetical protein
MAADHFSTDLDTNQPLVALFITGDFDAVCSHTFSMADPSKSKSRSIPA